MRSFLVAALAFTGYVSATSLWRRQDSQPPACAQRCLNTNTNNVSTGSCAADNFVCLCTSTEYVQGVINCIATDCSNHDDVLTAIQYSAGFCGIAGVNTVLPVTTPASQLPSTGSASASGSGSATGSANATSSATASSTSSSASASSTPNGALSSLKAPSVAVGALLLAAGAALQL